MLYRYWYVGIFYKYCKIIIKNKGEGEESKEKVKSRRQKCRRQKGRRQKGRNFETLSNPSSFPEFCVSVPSSSPLRLHSIDHPEIII